MHVWCIDVSWIGCFPASELEEALSPSPEGRESSSPRATAKGNSLERNYEKSKKRLMYGLWIICHNVNQCDQLINMSHRSFFWHLFQSWVARFLHLFSFLKQAPGFPGISENLHPNQHGEESGTLSPLIGAFHKSFLNGLRWMCNVYIHLPRLHRRCHRLMAWWIFFRQKSGATLGNVTLKRFEEGFSMGFSIVDSLTSVYLLHDLWQNLSPLDFHEIPSTHFAFDGRGGGTPGSWIWLTWAFERFTSKRITNYIPKISQN